MKPGRHALLASDMLCGMKFLLWIAVFVFVLWLLRKLRTSGVGRRVPTDRPVERMVRCDFCGVNHPIGESVKASGLNYCCSAHLQAAEKNEEQRNSEGREG